MPLAKLKPVDLPAEPSVVSADLAQARAVASPARLLQQRLASGTAPEPARWPLRYSVALIVTTSCVLWLAILTAATQAIRALA